MIKLIEATKTLAVPIPTELKDVLADDAIYTDAEHFADVVNALENTEIYYVDYDVITFASTSEDGSNISFIVELQKTQNGKHIIKDIESL